PFLLAALPQLQDDFFSRAVVLITKHGTQGAEGLILNKPIADEDALKGDLYLGGPVQGDLLSILHRENLWSALSQDVGSGIYISQSEMLVDQVLGSFEEFREPNQNF